MMEKLPPWLGRAIHRVRPGLHATVSHRHELRAPATLTLTSTAFGDGHPLGAEFTGDGDGISPPLAWAGIPAGVMSLVLIVEDADSPTPVPLVHAIVWGIQPTTTELAARALGQADGPLLGENSFFKPAWLPPDPPPGHGAHRYVFQLFALDRHLDLTGHPGRRAVVAAMRGHVVARGQLIGTYERR